ncbi:hypothetical protein LCGC14_0810610 [marine sediment metagenome]|uniref:Uncharacterized protein n=1 Tax=marine sediment metagenome TaxID=412755 RepID=A0A0F9SU83_9ZZZZ
MDVIKMEYNVSSTFSFDLKTITSLNELKKKYRVNKSELLRKFTNYFNKNRKELEKLIEEGVE